MLICKKCRTKITQENFWSSKHKGHPYIWTEDKK